MAAKRIHDESDHESDQSEEKRMRRLPSFGTVIKEAVLAAKVQNFCIVLEPMLRKVVKEEIERTLVQSAWLLQRTPQMQIEMVEQSTLQLSFKKLLSLPIFTGSKIEDEEGNPLQIFLIDTRNGQRSIAQHPSPLRVEIVVVDGDFPSGFDEDWTSDEFNGKIVRERTGRRPLIVGDVSVTLRDGSATMDELMFTDNSSWIKGRNFRIAARVVPGTYEGPRIKEAMTERFVVKDHRGELYRKHYPPSLGDEVWRLERIGKDGAFHKKLSAERIMTVQDFLKLSVVSPQRLRDILGGGMSDRMWDGTLSHAKTCQMGDKLYLHRGPHCTILLNSICEVVQILIDGIPCRENQLNGQQKVYVQCLAREAYQNWDRLEEANGCFLGNTPLLQNGPVPQAVSGPSSVYPGHQGNATFELQIGGFFELEGSTSNVPLAFNDTIDDQTCPTSTFQWSPCPEHLPARSFIN